jgi:aryl-alcohol dehydrogenase-like predicted oxidoreductase
MGGPGPFGWGSVDDDESVQAIHHALDSGVNWIDTAAVYGFGHSEEVVGKAVAGRDDVYVFSKCGRSWYGRPDGVIENDLRPESIRHEVEQSLRRLDVERIDLMQFHWPDLLTGTRLEDSWGTLGELQQEGKVRWTGVSNFDVGQLETCEAIRHVDSLQPPLSMLTRGVLQTTVPWAHAHGTGVIAYSPMGSGMLTGKYDRERVAQLEEGDWRHTSPTFTEPELSRNLELVDRLRPIAERLGVPMAALAVAWVLAQEGVTAAIVGARRPEQVDGWLPAADLELDEATQEEIRAALDETGAGTDEPPQLPARMLPGGEEG